MSVRPLLPADEIAYRNFFLLFTARHYFLSVFRHIRVFSLQMAQDHWAQLDYRRNITLIGQVRKKGNREIMAIGSYAGFEDGRAEVAFVVREDFQGMGISSYFLEKLEEIAITNGYKGFFASVLPENKAMLHIFLKRFPDAVVKQSGSEVRVIMDFKR